jgi:hypothetical protein
MLVDLEAPTDWKAEVNNPSDMTGKRTPIKVLDKRKDDRSIGQKREPNYQVQGDRLERPESKTLLSDDDFNNQYWQTVRNVARNYELREVTSHRERTRSKTRHTTLHRPQPP